ncbi:MAG: NADH:flavin oxidoreductase/NADH oxidase [Pseudoclavibacter sp.]
MSEPLLLDPITIRDLVIPNRIWLPPMCQYSVDARDGVPTDWHLVHLGARAVGGFGLIIAEATAVVPEGRITPQDTGLWNDAQVAAWRRITGFIRAQGARSGVQLQHAGRKGSTYRPWDAQRGTVPAEDGGWTPVGPSAIAYPGYATPHELTTDEAAAIPAQFAAAARRAQEAGFDVVELHGAHGYLLHQFLSPLSNHRTDRYGGDLHGRARLLLETAAAVRAVWTGPLLVRLSATDWVDVSTGGNAPARIPAQAGYQVFAAARVRRAGLPVTAVGLITEPEQAEQVLVDGAADAIEIGRAALDDPNWALHAADRLTHRDRDRTWPAPLIRGRRFWVK